MQALGRTGQRLRLAEATSTASTSTTMASSGSAATRQGRRHDPEVHARRQVRDADRQGRPDARATTTPTQLGQPADICDRSRTRTSSTSPTATAITASSCSTPQTGAYKRHWGAYGKRRRRRWTARTRRLRSEGAAVAEQFGNPVHCVKIANDGLVYVCDRINDRIQVFRKDGTFVQESFYEKKHAGTGSVWDLYLWPDRSRAIFSASTATTTRSGSCAARTARWSAPSDASAAMPGSSTGPRHRGRHERQRLHGRGR